jgi:hypothetical protein
MVKGLGAERQGNKEEQFIYLLVMISKGGFISEGYKFVDVENWAYFANFMKLLLRIINQADKAEELSIRNSTMLPNGSQYRSFTEYEEMYSKYLSIFFNQKTP